MQIAVCILMYITDNDCKALSIIIVIIKWTIKKKKPSAQGY